MDYSTFQNKNVLISGASSGIGLALAKDLSKEDCNLILLARRKNLLDDFISESNISHKAFAFQCDVSNKEESKKVFDEIISKYGKVDIAILNAAVNSRNKAGKFDSSDAEYIISVNYLGLIYWIELILPDFIKDRRGTIVGVSSLADAKGFPGSGFYCASKAAVTHILESLRIEMKKFNVKVITVKPGFVKTPMTDKNEFHMPFLMDVSKSSKIILNGIRKGRRIIEFPLPTTIGSKILKFMPTALFEWLLSRKLKQKKS